MEQKYLKELREEIVENLHKPNREGRELLDEIYSIDCELADTALFMLSAEEYRIPEPEQVDLVTDYESVNEQQEVLF